MKKLGPFELGPRIGRGGMASVYLARDWRKGAVHSVLALKVMREEFAAQESYVSMFLDEARILARLHHPNLIHVIEAGTGAFLGDPESSGREHHYIAMELLLGRTLADLWDLLAERGARIPLHLAAAIAARVAHGLHHAHELRDEAWESLQLIHRDVNPSNVFLTADGRVKLIDFGLARARDTVRIDQRGMVTGKVTYLAPEQLTPRPCDRRTDIYQLGITLWEMVTGARLFLRDTPQESAAAVRRGEIPRPEELNPGVPGELSQILTRALAADPDRRFTSMLGFARALDNWLQQQPPATEKQLTDLFDQVFPDERQRLENWRQEVTRPRVHAMTDRTIAPPAPIAGVSTDSVQPAPLSSSADVRAKVERTAEALEVETPADVRPSEPPSPPERRSRWSWWKGRR